MDVKKELEAIFDDPLLDISDTEKELFSLPEEMKTAVQKMQAEYVAQRRPCEDFDEYASRFEQVHRELKAGKRHLVKLTKTENLKAGDFYVVEGQMLLLDKIIDKRRDLKFHRDDGRTRCIYENGTESDILLQTLRKNVMSGGYAVTATEEQVLRNFFKESDITADDHVTGYVYVLRSLSQNPQIRSRKDLYKIGFSTTLVENRIANAANEPTYLMAGVKIVETFKIVNMNSHKFEALIHQLFEEVKFHVEVRDALEKVHQPQEWYIVPLDIIVEVVERIGNGTITNYKYNAGCQCLELVAGTEKGVLDVYAGKRELKLMITQKEYNGILNGNLDTLSCKLNQTTLNRYTYLDPSDGKRYLHRYDILRLTTKGRTHNSILVDVEDIRYENGVVVYQFGKDCCDVTSR